MEDGDRPHDERRPGFASRYVLGFANRDPARAVLHAEGVAYLIVGAEPGDLIGAPRHDPAELEDWLSPYIGPDVAWNPEYVSVEGKPVLLIQVEAPKPGEKMRPLRRGYEDLEGKKHVPAGRIFIRKRGKTEEADDADVDMLNARAAAGTAAGPKLELRVELEGPLYALPEPWFSDVARTGFISEEAKRLAPPAEAGDLYTSFVRRDTRGLRRYQADVESYLAQLEQLYPHVVAAAAVEAKLVPLQVTIANEGEDNFAAVELELRFSNIQRNWLFLDGEEARELLHTPEPPEPWGRCPTWRFRIRASRSSTTPRRSRRRATRSSSAFPLSTFGRSARSALRRCCSRCHPTPPARPST